MALSGWLGTQNHSSVPSAPYDDTGWSVGAGTFRYDDNVVGGIALGPSVYTHILRTIAFGFGSVIPSPSTINGIEVRINIYNPQGLGYSRLSFVRLHDNGVVLGTSYGAGDQIATPTSSMKNYGGSTDLWGNSSLSRTTVTGPQFGVELALQSFYAGVATTFIDSIEMQIDYTYTGGGGGGGTGGGSQTGRYTNSMRQQKGSISGFIGGR